MSKVEKALIFIDGNNFHHSMKKLGLPSLDLHYEKFSQKLVMEREWRETRYYVGQVMNEGNKSLYKTQRKFLSSLEKFSRVNSFLGSMKKRPNKHIKPLTRWLNAAPRRSDISVPDEVIAELSKIADDKKTLYAEKAVDVMIATDMVSMAFEDKYDTACLLSDDGDFAPAVKKVRETDRKVFVASATPGHELKQVASKFIPLKREFFHECWV